MYPDHTAPAVPLDNPNAPNIVILVTGSRHARPERWTSMVAGAIWDHTQGEPYELVHGAGRGIDLIADSIAFRTNPVWIKAAKVTRFPADWASKGLAAGPIRNAQMRDYVAARRGEGAQVWCLAFHDDLEHSRGTKHMVRIASAAGFPIEIFDGKGVQ